MASTGKGCVSAHKLTQMVAQGLGARAPPGGRGQLVAGGIGEGYQQLPGDGDGVRCQRSGPLAAAGRERWAVSAGSHSYGWHGVAGPVAGRSRRRRRLIGQLFCQRIVQSGKTVVYACVWRSCHDTPCVNLRRL
jgi:hypothetical protein